jgi:tRNA A37 threonylcarbamoyladenosine modification protein TsaB
MFILFIFRKSAEDSQLFLWDGIKKSARKIKESQKVRKNILKEIDAFLKSKQKIANQLTGIVTYVGPGQFSFLRTSISIVNTFGYALNIPVVGVQECEYEGKDFFSIGLEKIKKVKKFQPIAPAYGKEPNITKPK